MKSIVYVDGFNLFYGIRRYEKQGKCYRWLDLSALCQALLPQDTISQIRYFTALVNDEQDVDSPVRQQIYLRALKTIPNLSMHFGRFLPSEVWQPLVNPLSSIPKHSPSSIFEVQKNGVPTGIQLAYVKKMEEKGSDVNIATYMLLDCFRKACDRTVIISNDSDLTEPVRVIRHEFKRNVVVFNPGVRFSSILNRTANRYTKIEESQLQSSQFAQTLQDATGTITKPNTW